MTLRNVNSITSCGEPQTCKQLKTRWNKYSGSRTRAKRTWWDWVQEREKGRFAEELTQLFWNNEKWCLPAPEASRCPHRAPHLEEPVLSLVPHCRHLEILNNFWTRDFAFVEGPANCMASPVPIAWWTFSWPSLRQATSFSGPPELDKHHWPSDSQCVGTPRTLGSPSQLQTSESI